MIDITVRRGRPRDRRAERAAARTGDAGNHDNALEIIGLTAGYAGAPVIHDVSLRVPRNGAVAVLGPNGAGKTTLMRTAAGFVRPDSGTVLVGGVDVTHHPPVARFRAGLCDIPDGRGVFPALSVKDNLRLFTSSRTRDHAVDAATFLFPVLGRRLGQTAGSMSGGEQQMLALARAYITNPKVILIDEVSLGLAPVILDEVFGALAEMRSRGSALLVVEQYVHRALDLVDRACILVGGRVVLEGTSREVSDVDLHEVYLHSAEPAGTPAKVTADE